MIHELKIWPEHFDAVAKDKKKFEVRKNDRDFKVGDTLILWEWNPESKSYTGWKISRKITYILEGGQFGIEKGFVVMSII